MGAGFNVHTSRLLTSAAAEVMSTPTHVASLNTGNTLVVIATRSSAKTSTL